MNADQIEANSSKSLPAARPRVMRVMPRVAIVGALMIALAVVVSSSGTPEAWLPWVCFAPPAVATAAYLIRATIRSPRYTVALFLSAGIVLCLVLYLAAYISSVVSAGEMIFGT